MTHTTTPADLRAIDLFEELDDEALAEWAAVAEPFSVAAGETIAEQGVTPRGVILLFSGLAQAMIVEGGRLEPAGLHHPPTWMGAIGVLTGGGLGVRMRAEEDCELARIEPEDFRRLAFAHPTVHDRVMRQIAPVMSRITAIEQNRERLAALGQLSAGLAHELNNPAAAAQRAAAQMAEALEVVSGTIRPVRRVRRRARRGGGARRAPHAGVARRRTQDGSTRSTPPTPRTSSPTASRSSASPSRGGWPSRSPPPASTRRGSDRVTRSPGPATDAALAGSPRRSPRAAWPTSCRSRRRRCRTRRAVKTYAYMDRGELVEVDLHEGIETTLRDLKHKVKNTSIEVVRDYDRSLPRLTVRGSELNQVWTNLVHNAIQALGERGTITITTRRKGDCAIVDVSDDGPGIPEADQKHIFEQFLHDQGGRARHRPRAGDGAPDRRRPPRRLADVRVRAGPHDLPRLPPLRPTLIERPRRTHAHLHPPRARPGPGAPRRRRGLRGLPGLRRPMAAPADLPGMRPRRLLRRLAQPARDRPRAGLRPPDHPLARAGRGLVVVLRDEVAMRIPEVKGNTRIPKSPLA
jgi:signal transduction histidine kinase